MSSTRQCNFFLKKKAHLEKYPLCLCRYLCRCPEKRVFKVYPLHHLMPDVTDDFRRQSRCFPLNTTFNPFVDDYNDDYRFLTLLNDVSGPAACPRFGTSQT